MKMLATVVLFLSFIPLTFSQVFVTEKSLTEINFNGTMMGSGQSKTGIVTLRETPKTQELLIVLEVADFKFDDHIQEDDFNDTFMESSLYPQIRLSATIKEKIDLTKDAIYIIRVPTKMTIRRNSKTLDFKIRLEISSNRITFAFEKDVLLTDYQIPYAGQGSEIGTHANMKLHAHLIRRI